MNALISVIIPVYNVERYLERCVQSVCQQSYKNLEILLVNDGSTDNSGTICDSLAKEDGRIQVIHKKNGGLSDARNVGQQQSTGDYLLFIDSDDYIHPQMIQTLQEQLIKEDADVSSCNVMNVYQNHQSPQYDNQERYFVFDQEAFLKEYLIGQYVPGTICNKLIRKEIAAQLLFPVGKIYEDAYYHYQLIQVATKFVVNTKPYYYYYHREESITTTPYRSLDMLYVEIYQQFNQFVNQSYPQLKEAAFFRLSYAYFYVFDKMLQHSDYKQLHEYARVRDYLKKNAWKIAKNSIFQKGRRIAAVVLKISVAAYRQLMLANEAKHKQIHRS